ncbi:hypothetical protein IWT140_02293 [Secundilactobacillus pentosiphilus]|uniref:Phage protein n=1 Tax=Secundilactobacillus pentosiphilus TaxID=1714682 RepID=A0A1Z5ISD3_9LACO|nr:DUF1617 family protein [Secundilactobacillus pentosiphilus]GAX04650.1 hypothetical protein IWT140_02293 [Secundilactobacillus pentosiphilus]
MQIKFKNNDLDNIVSMINDLTIKGASINRARFSVLKLLNNQLEDLNEFKKQLIDQYADKDKEGNPLVEDNQYSFTGGNAIKFQNEFNTLMAEEVKITIDDYSNQFKKLYDYLNSYDKELTGASAYAFGAFLDELEAVGINK